MLDRIHAQVAVRQIGTRKVRQFKSIDAANLEFKFTAYGSSPLRRIRRALKEGYTVQAEFNGKKYEFSMVSH